MGCCGRKNTKLRSQPIPRQIEKQENKLKPLSTRIFTNSKSQQEFNEAADNKLKLDKCPSCQHPVMTVMIGGRNRKKCTNFSCRKILD